LRIEKIGRVWHRIAMLDRSATPGDRRRYREALSASLRAYALALHHAGATYAQIGGTLGASLERARQIVLKAKRLAEQPNWFDRLPARAVNFLSVHGLDALPESEAARAVARLTRRELLSQPNFGRGACDAVRRWLACRGLALVDESATETKKGVLTTRDALLIVATPVLRRGGKYQH
jgi:hypothetical protein